MTAPIVGVPMTLQPQRAEAGREHLRVRRRAPVLQHDLRTEEAGERPRVRLGAARLPDLIFALYQDAEQLLIDVAAAVPSLIDDQRLLAAILAQLFLELP